MEIGDKLKISFIPEMEELLVEESGSFPLPQNVRFVRIEHEEVASRINGVNGVCVDLVRKRA
jgi:hypothetical protein